MQASALQPASGSMPGQALEPAPGSATERLMTALDRAEQASARLRARSDRLEQAAKRAIARIDRLLTEPAPDTPADG